MLTIKLTQETYYKDGKRKGWQLKVNSTEQREISENEHRLLTDEQQLKFFRALGGSESVQRSYTNKGYKATKLISTSPDKQQKVIREYKFE